MIPMHPYITCLAEASCTLWGIYSVLFRNVRQVKLSLGTQIDMT